MYCVNCGKKINNNDNFCTGCGVKIENNTEKNNTSLNNNHSNNNGLKVASIILGSVSILGTLMFIFAPVCLILSIVGLILGLFALKKGSNIWGILLSSVGLVLSLLATIIIIFLIFLMFNGYDYHEYSGYFEKFDNVYEHYNFGDF